MKSLPHDEAAEKAWLGAAFLDDGLFRGLDFPATAFYQENHRLIFAAMADLAGRKEAVDFITVSGLLKNRGELDQAGGAAYLMELVDFVPTSANAGFYLNRILDSWQRRQAITQQRKIAAGFWDTEKPLADTLDELRAASVELSGEVLNARAVELLDYQERQRRYADFIKNIDRLRFLTGFPPVDELLRGVAPGEVLRRP